MRHFEIILEPVFIFRVGGFVLDFVLEYLPADLAFPEGDFIWNRTEFK
jgi:hypothetical protein